MSSNVQDVDTSSLLEKPPSLVALALLAVGLFTKDPFILSASLLVALGFIFHAAFMMYRPQSLLPLLEDVLRSLDVSHQAVDRAGLMQDSGEFIAELKRLQQATAAHRTRTLEVSLRWHKEVSSMFTGLVQEILATLKKAEKLQEKLENMKRKANDE